jgi:8-oxo-dGTP pyrophosphatase MutT (NUDIX family)
VTSSPPKTEIVALDRAEIILESWSWRFAAERRNEIDRNFAEIQRARPAVWNGRVVLLNRYAIRNGVLRGACFETDFASLCAWRTWNFPDAGVANFFGVAALCAADGGFLVGEMAPSTANAGMLYFPCGTPEPGDVDAGGALDLAGNVGRELLEETGLDIDELNAEPGWTLVRDGCYLALLKRVRSPSTAEELRARVMRHLAGEQRPEFVDIRIVRSPADFDTAMPRFVTAFLNDFWSRAASRP